MTQDWMKLEPSPTSPPLQVKPEPNPPTKSEQRILDLLWSEFRKSDDVARAAARFDAEVHDRIVQQRIDEGMTEDEAGEIQRVFNPDEFNDSFRRFLQLRIDRRLLRLLNLGDYEEEIMRERIQQAFSKQPTRSKRVSVPQEAMVQVGNAETQQVQDLKRRGRRRR